MASTQEPDVAKSTRPSTPETDNPGEKGPRSITRLFHNYYPWLGLLLRLGVGAVWVTAGAMKISNLNQSVIAVQAYQILPNSVAQAVGIVLPMIEIAIGLLLILGLATAPAAIVSGLLFLAFVIGISAAWARGLQIDCGCFGGGGELEEGVDPGYLGKLLQDGGLLLCSALLVWRPGTKFSADELIFKTK